jgi:uncharacterized membrane protein YphA (DoxX/SURF4 family)
LSVSQPLKKIVLSPWLHLFVRFAIGSVFVYAGFIKLLDPKAFAKIISHYDIVSENLLPFLAVGLPLVEFLAGAGLIFNIRGSLSIIFVLLMMFGIVLGYGIFNDLNIDCGCFTTEEINQQNSLLFAFYRDLILIGGAFFLLLSKTFCQKSVKDYDLSGKIKSLKGRE